MGASLRIETERLVLRSFEIADEETFVTFLTDPDFMQHSRSGAQDESTVRMAFAQRLKTDGQFGKLALIEKQTDCMIGYCGVDTCELEDKQELELGYRLIASARGHGYATEAACAVLDYYRQQSVIDIIAFTAYGNNPSQNVLKKLGYKMIKTGEIESFPIIIFRR